MKQGFGKTATKTVRGGWRNPKIDEAETPSFLLEREGPPPNPDIQAGNERGSKNLLGKKTEGRDENLQSSETRKQGAYLSVMDYARRNRCHAGKGSRGKEKKKGRRRGSSEKGWGTTILQLSPQRSTKGKGP